MSRRRQEVAAEAAERASEAGRILQAQRQVNAEPEAVEPVQTEGERPPSRNEPRRLAMEEIEQRDLAGKGLAETKAPEVVPENPPPPTPESMLEGAKFSEAPPVEPAEVTPEAITETPAAPAAPAMVQVKVDGEEFSVPQTDIDEYGGVKAYQIAKAAENRLRKANETVAQTQRQQAALVQWIQQQQQPQVTPQQYLQSKIDVIRYGSPEESAAALQEVIERANPRIDHNALTMLAVSRTQQALAADKFKEEFSDVVASPLMFELAQTLENKRIAQLQQAGQQPNWPVFYRQLGNEIRSAMGKPSQPTPAATPGTPSQGDKEAKKASIVTLPTAAARAEPPKESKPESRDDTLTQMRKSRGLPT